MHPLDGVPAVLFHLLASLPKTGFPQIHSRTLAPDGCAMNLIIENDYNRDPVSIEMWHKRCVILLFLVVSDFCSGNDG